ncbi:SH2 domain-containing adapter protein F [Lemmus lemmus]
MLLSGAPPPGSGPGPRAQGSGGGGPGGSRRGAGSAGAGPGGGGSGGVAKWLREHLGFRGGGGAACPASPPAPPPDILAAYRLQRDRDFEDPYSGSSSVSAALSTPAAPGPTPPPRHGSPPHRLIRVETPGPPAPPPEERISGPHASSDRDYADPFDVQEKKVPENDGYMEPYEAQKMMAETAAQPLPLYDTPYEPEDEGGSPEAEGTPWPRESRLPEDDERPPEEYDQPWEWKKERISKAFAVHWGLPPYSSPPGTRDTRNGWAWTARDPAEMPPFPSLILSWYHGAISRTDAENLLRLCKEASYLVRNSETSKNDFSLSLKSSQGFMHMKLSRTKEHKYVLGQNSPPFSSVPEIVHHYASRKLPIKGAEHMSLLYPVAIRTL